MTPRTLGAPRPRLSNAGQRRQAASVTAQIFRCTPFSSCNAPMTPSRFSAVGLPSGPNIPHQNLRRTPEHFAQPVESDRRIDIGPQRRAALIGLASAAATARPPETAPGGTRARVPPAPAPCRENSGSVAWCHPSRRLRFSVVARTARRGLDVVLLPSFAAAAFLARITIRGVREHFRATPPLEPLQRKASPNTLICMIEYDDL